MASKFQIKWWEPEFGADEQKRVSEVLSSHFINEGSVTAEFERALSEYLDVPYVIATTSGTSALFLALKGLGIGAGDEVIVPDLTFIATANAVTLTGATPVLVDIDPNTLQVSVDAIEKKINSKTKAILPVHLSGRAAPMSQILALAKKKNLFVVEDSAEALTSRYNGRYLGTIGNAGILSFSPNKTITTGQGGAVLTHDRALYLEIKMLKDQGRPERGTGGDDLHPHLGFNFKFTDLQAAVGLAQLTRLKSRTERMKQIYKWYRSALGDLNELKFFEIREEIPQWTDVVTEYRDELDSYLSERGIQCRRFWHPLHTQKPYIKGDKEFPNATKLSPKALWLPSSFLLKDEEIETICQCVRTFYQSRLERKQNVSGI